MTDQTEAQTTTVAPPAETPKATKAKAAKVAKPPRITGESVAVLGSSKANLVTLGDILPDQFYTFGPTEARGPLQTDGTTTVGVVRRKVTAAASKWATQAKVFRVRALTAAEQTAHNTAANFIAVHTTLATKAPETPVDLNTISTESSPEAPAGA